MDDTGLRRRRGQAGDPDARAAQPAPASAPAAAPGAAIDSGVDYSDLPPATMAAAFFTSKGIELLNFAKRKVEQRGVTTRLVAPNPEYNVLLMNLPYDNMLSTAEELGLRKRDLEGNIRTFRAADVDLFASSIDTSLLFSQSEQLLCLEYRLDRIKPDSNFDDVLGNESILEWCKRQNYLDDVFPLHDPTAANQIMAELSFAKPLYDVGGISKLQDYFGDKVALYFCFLVFYTKMLVTCAIAGGTVAMLSFLIPTRSSVLLFLYSIFSTLWAALLTSLWKRKNVEIVYMWTSLIMGDSSDMSLMSMTKKEDLRRKFFGIEVSHRITGEKIVVFPKRQRMMRLAVSFVVVLVSLFVSTRLMMAGLDFEDIMNEWLETKADLYKWSSPVLMKTIVLKNVPLVVYLACLNILNMAYNIIAKKLTENENHKYNSEHENSLVLKLVLFQFLNMNMAYLYVAFVRRDYERLASSIRSVLLVELVIGNIKETVIPIFLARRRRQAKLDEALKKKKEQNPDLDESECFVKPSDLDPISTQLEMEPDSGVFEDYFELVRQFSQITLFAAAFPLGAVLAAINNFIEVYTDTYKLIHMTRRSSPRRALDIGAWVRAFEFISVMSIMTNLGIITVTGEHAHAVVGKGIPKTEEYFWMIAIEHILLIVRVGLMTMYEGIPSWVRDQRAKERYLASKKSRSQTS
ncbi:Anoctamin [Gracilaria domingensis]|nr:Anoctamin [Gracilaria domingensis]